MAKYRWGLERLFFVFVLAFVTTWMTINLISSGTEGFSVKRIIDGDTIVLSNNQRVRLLGIDAPDYGVEGSEKAAIILEELIDGGRVWVEGDRHKKDIYGRELGWLWIRCESNPEFKPDSYMEAAGRVDNPWVEANPMGCQKGMLANEILLKMGLANIYFVDGEGELKYEERLRQIEQID